MKCMNLRASKADDVFSGRYTLTDDKVQFFTRLQLFCLRYANFQYALMRLEFSLVELN